MRRESRAGDMSWSWAGPGPELARLLPGSGPGLAGYQVSGPMLARCPGESKPRNQAGTFGL